MTPLTPPNVILDELDARTYLALPRRAYDFAQGDRRFRSLKKAADHADAEALRTGVRQVIRRDTDNLGEPLFLVQAVGS